MTVVSEQPALFEVTPEGGLVAAVDMQSVEAPIDYADWGDTTQQLTQGERAMIAVAPREIAVAQRAGHLVNALEAISEANRLNGFTQAVVSPRHRPAIENVYGAHTDDIASGAGHKALTGERRARYEFFAASGLGSLALATQETPLTAHERTARRVLSESWNSFRDVYGGTGPKVNTQRNTYKAALINQIEYTNK